MPRKIQTHARAAATAQAGRVTLHCRAYPQVRVDDVPVPFPLRRGLALLFVLSEAGRLSRSALSGLLWPDAAPTLARGRLRRLVHEVNALLGADVVVGDVDALWTASPIESDVAGLKALAMRAVASPLEVAGRDTIEVLVAADATQILPGFDIDSDVFAAWLDDRRADQLRLLVRGLGRLGTHLLEHGPARDAAEVAEALVRLDPLADTGHLLRLGACAASGDAAGVESAYFACAELLRAELGIRPSAQIEAAYADASARLAGKAQARGDAPAIRFADASDGAVAYLELGERDARCGTLLILFGIWSHVEVSWEEPRIRAMLERLARRFHVVLMDRRGVGLSERLTLKASVDAGVDDVEAVRRAVGATRVWLFGNSVGGTIAMAYAAAFPARTSGLLLYATHARTIWARDYPWALKPVQLEAWIRKLQASWGRATSLAEFAPSVADDPVAQDWWARLLRQSASRDSMPRLLKAFARMDVRDRLERIRCPTLVLQREGDRIVRAAVGRFLAARIPGAQLALLPGQDNLLWCGDTAAALDCVEAFAESVATADT